MQKMFSQRRKPKEYGEIEKGRICCSILRDHEIPHMGATHHGGVAQLGEHLPCKQGVMGSNPIISITEVRRKTDRLDRTSTQRSKEAETIQIAKAKPNW